MVNTDSMTVRDAEHVFRDILGSLGGFEAIEAIDHSRANCDLVVEARTGRAKLRFGIEAKKMLTPRRAFGSYQNLRRLPKDFIRLIYAPVISPRVASQAKEQGIGYFDAAGNCWIRSERDRLLIERNGRTSPRQTLRSAADPFSPKSSRIVRAMLSEPTKGWQVRELAEHEQVRVSPGLVVKVKRALVDEGYAIEHESLLRLCDPTGLLEAWATKYPGPQRQLSLYLRGDTATAEQVIGQWCQQNKLVYALGGLSAAWRLASETRYNVASVYVEDRGFEDKLLTRLDVRHGGKQVDSGANLQLWQAFDVSVFAGKAVSKQDSLPTTSPIQTYLDTKRTAGRGEDAAGAIFEKYLRRQFSAVAERSKESQDAI